MTISATTVRFAELVSEGYDVPEARRLAREDMEMREKLIAQLEALHPRPPSDDDFAPGQFTPETPAAPAAAVESDPPSPMRGPRIRGI
jgi:hypothetical protein